MEEFSSLSPARTRPTKCLMGVTILMVEDSRSSSEALRLMATASGARVRRADSLNAAKRHLGSFRPTVALVDIGLPDGDGIELIKAISSSEDHDIPVIAMSGTDPHEIKDPAFQAGATAFLEKPVSGLSLFQRTILELLPDRLPDAAQNARFDASLPALDHSYLELDLENACDLLREGIQAGDREELGYCAKFMVGVAKQMSSTQLMELAVQLGDRLGGGNPGENAAAELLKAIESQLGTLRAAAG